MRCGRGRSQQRVQPLQAEGQVGAALGRRHRVDLVDDHRVDVRQRLAGPGREQQVQRLRGGDEDVGGCARQLAALLGRGVAGAHPDGDVGRAWSPERGPPPAACPTSGARRLRSTSYGQRLQRRHVEHPAGAAARAPAAAPARPSRATGTRPGSCPTRSARRPARPVLGEGVPGPDLGLGGRGERALEPASGRGREAPEPGGRSRCCHPPMLVPDPDKRRLWAAGPRWHTGRRREARRRG